MSRLKGPTPNTGRAQWQIDNAAKCGCRGTDDLCPCQNDPELFTRAVIDWEDRALAAEASRDEAIKRAERVEEEIAALRADHADTFAGKVVMSPEAHAELVGRAERVEGLLGEAADRVRALVEYEEVAAEGTPWKVKANGLLYADFDAARALLDRIAAWREGGE